MSGGFSGGIACNLTETAVGNLSAASIAAKLKTPGKHSDGDGLFLVVRERQAGLPGFSASWIARLQFGGKRREYGLGSADLVTLAQAREKTRAYRR